MCEAFASAIPPIHSLLWHNCTMHECTIKLVLFLLLSTIHVALGCYKFPKDMRDPCLDKECHFGSRCRPSTDGLAAECACVEKCATYGDSRGSRPVCGSDGRDYQNVCELERTSCRETREIIVKYQGHCGEWFFHLLSVLLMLSLYIAECFSSNGFVREKKIRYATLGISAKNILSVPSTMYQFHGTFR